MALALISWTIGTSLLLCMIRLFMTRENVAAIAVLLILIPQVFIRPVIFFTGADNPFPYEYFGSPDWALVATALLVASAWIAIFSITHLIFFRAMTPFGKLLPQAPAHFDIRILLLAALGTTALGALLTSKLVLEAGSLANFMFQVKVGKEMNGSYIIREISVTAAIFSTLVILFYEKQYRSHSGNSSSRALVWTGCGLVLINLAFNYAWGNRYNLAMLALASALAWHLHIQRIRLKQAILLALIAAAVLQGLKLFRNEAVEIALDRDIVRNQSFWLDISTSLHFNQFDAFMLALRDAGHRFPFRDGQDFVNGLLAWIPREFFPQKETFHVGKWFRQVYEPNVVNGWPVTTMGSWYVNFGAFGILFGGIISGIIAAWFDAGYRNVRISFWQATIAPAIAFLMFDGGVGTGFIQDIFLVLAPIYLLTFTLKITSKRSLQVVKDR